MAKAAIPVDLFNPGQVFACLGFLEAAEILLGDAEGGFEWDDGEARFVLAATGDESPIARVLRFLNGATVSELAPKGWTVPLSRRKNETDEKYEKRLAEHEAWLDSLEKTPVFASAGPESAATLATAMRAAADVILLDYWTDGSSRDNVKFWAGAGGYPGSALARDALDLIRAGVYGTERIFDVAAPQSSSFRFDWRRDYIAIDTGFAVNDHGDITMVGYPLVEMMAAIGVTHARPQRLDKLRYRYSVIGGGAPGRLLPPSMLRAALGCAPLPFPQRFF
jgi:CRISPR-associated protein Csb3